ncbi:hypothetical protein [Micromonospora sp. WMMD980]|uniref:hypothetical protein n=1 Tax=Micromonospora sp. WMMD980 TaxID=3016088 RepID=UPI002416F4A8|nr:hypothetical protein [Micromonospora sp. WMMD980]MDG4799033.1 hypothetical protein [Micromonospora sp. WMMD980]
MSETNPPVAHARLTEMTFCALPEDNINHDIYAVTVTWRGGEQYAVKRHSQVLGADGEWDYEPSPSNRNDEWIATHRFDYDTACRLAMEACQHITVNGLTVADALARAGGR